jgi:hypothetical protein
MLGGGAPPLHVFKHWLAANGNPQEAAAAAPPGAGVAAAAEEPAPPSEPEPEPGECWPLAVCFTEPGPLGLSLGVIAAPVPTPRALTVAVRSILASSVSLARVLTSFPDIRRRRTAPSMLGARRSRWSL